MFGKRNPHREITHLGYDWRDFEKAMGLRLVFNHFLPGDEAIDLERVYVIAYLDYNGREPHPSIILKACNDRLDSTAKEPTWLVHFHRKVFDQIENETYEFLLYVGIFAA